MSKSKGGGGSALTKVSTLAFVGMTCALAVSIRNIPDVAQTGWTMFFYMLVATILFGFPISLIAGEFTTAFPGEGGPELWNTKSLSQRWGFTTSWLLWVQMFPGMVMVASVLAPLAGYVINDVSLGENNIFTLVMILVVYWAVTFLNMKFDMAHIGGKIGIWLGLYIPIVLMFVLGLAAVIHSGIDPRSTLGDFNPAKLVPDASDWSSLSMFAPIIFIFTGIEMSSVYVTRLKDPSKQYPIGIFVSLLLMFVFNIANAVLVSAVVPDGQMQLNNISQAVVIYVQILGLPGWFVNVFAALVFVGVVVQLSGWVSGPSQTITASARRGQYPPKWNYWKKNKLGLSNRVLITQAAIISIFACVYLLIPAINTAFLMLVNATTILYCIVYAIMAVGIIKLRKDQPNLSRPFAIGRHGNGLCFFVAILLLVVMVAANGLTYLTSSTANNIVVTIISIVLFVIPLIIDKKKKPSWLTEVNQHLIAEGKTPEIATPDDASAKPSDSAPSGSASAKPGKPAGGASASSKGNKGVAALSDTSEATKVAQSFQAATQVAAAKAARGSKVPAKGREPSSSASGGGKTSEAAAAVAVPAATAAADGSDRNDVKKPDAASSSASAEGIAQAVADAQASLQVAEAEAAQAVLAVQAGEPGAKEAEAKAAKAVKEAQAALNLAEAQAAQVVERSAK